MALPQQETIVLTVLDVDKVKAYATSLKRSGFFPSIWHSVSGSLFGANEAADKQDENITHTTASGLTPKEVMTFIIMIPQKQIRHQLAAAIIPLITNPKIEDFHEALGAQFDMDQFNALEDEKGTAAITKDSTDNKNTSSLTEVYYAKALVRRENKKFYLNIAYFSFKSEVPTNKALRNSDEVREKFLIGSALAYNRLHRRLQMGWPDLIRLVPVDDIKAILKDYRNQ